MVGIIETQGDSGVETWVSALRDNPQKLTEPTAVNITDASLEFAKSLREQVESAATVAVAHEGEIVTLPPVQVV